MARSTPNPRQANGHRRRGVRAQVLREESDCWLCGQPVDKGLRTPDPMSPEVDEVIPVSLGGSPIDRANCRLAHRICNVRRGNGTKPVKEPKADTIATTRRWW